MSKKSRTNLDTQNYTSLANERNTNTSEKAQYNKWEDFNIKEDLKKEIEKLQEEINDLLRPEGVKKDHGWHDRLEGSIFKTNIENESLEFLEKYKNILLFTKNAIEYNNKQRENISVIQNSDNNVEENEKVMEYYNLYKSTYTNNDFHEIKKKDLNIRYGENKMIDTYTTDEIIGVIKDKINGFNKCSKTSTNRYFSIEGKKEKLLFEKYEKQMANNDTKKLEFLQEYFRKIAYSDVMLEIEEDLSKSNKDYETNRGKYLFEINKFLDENPNEIEHIKLSIPPEFIKDNKIIKDYLTLDNIYKYRIPVYGIYDDIKIYKNKYVNCVYFVGFSVEKPIIVNRLECHKYIEWTLSNNDLRLFGSLIINYNNPNEYPKPSVRFIIPNNENSRINHSITENSINIRQSFKYDIKYLLTRNILGIIIFEYKYKYNPSDRNSETRKWILYVYEHEISKTSYFIKEGFSILKYQIFNIEGKLSYPGLFFPNINVTDREFEQYTTHYKTKYPNMLFYLYNGTQSIYISHKSIASDKLYLINVTLNRKRIESDTKKGYLITKHLHVGGNNLKIQLQTTNSAEKSFYIKEISSYFYIEYYVKTAQIPLKFEHLLNSEKPYSKYIRILDKYHIIMDTSKFLKYDAIYTKSNTITKYTPTSKLYYHYNEIIKKYNIKFTNNISVLNIGTDTALLEIIGNNNYKIKDINFIITTNQSFLSYYDKIPDNIINIYDNLSHIYKIKLNKFTKSIYDLPFEDTKKYDIISYKVYVWNKNTNGDENIRNLINIYVGMLSIINYNKIGGSAILYIYSVVDKSYADIYYILKMYYTNVFLYHPEISNPFKRSGTFVMCQNLINNNTKDLNHILNKIKNIYPNDINDINIHKFKIIKNKTHYEPVIYKQTDNKPYISGFLNTSLPKDIDLYQEIIDFNNERYIKQLIFVQKLEKLIKIPESELPKMPTQEQITASIMYCKKWGIEYFDYFDSDVMKSKMGNDILSEMYGLHEPIQYTFKTPAKTKITPAKKYSTIKSRTRSSNSIKKTKKSTNISNISNSFNINDFLNNSPSTKNVNKYSPLKKISLMDEIFIINNKMNQTGKIIDSRRDFSIADKSKQLLSYWEANIMYRYYKHASRKDAYDIAEIVRKNIKSQVVSQAWLKMYEILANCRLIKKTKSYKTLHLCEAPGSFIACINHFIQSNFRKTGDPPIEFNWVAQSLNARHPINRKKYGNKIFSDDFGLISKYPERWIWGADGTGDITQIQNIKSYAKYATDVDLITSDCGLSMGTPGYENVAYSSLVAILYLLPKGKAFVYKVLLPIDTPLIWNLIYICYHNFEELQFFKPVQNQQSKEFYIIGKKYLGTDTTTLNKLLHQIENFNEDTDLFNDKYQEAFVRQIITIINKISDGWIYSIERQIYYSDNKDLLNKDFSKMARDFIQEKNMEWIHKYKIKPIDKYASL